MLALEKFHYKWPIMVNFQIHEIFIKNFGGVAPGLKFQKLKIHHNKLLIMKFSQWNKSLKRKNFFFEKCEQTAEISWLFFWDVKISKKSIKENFVVFYRDVKTYLTLCRPSTQCEISHLPNIHFLLFVVIFKRKNFRWKIQLI